MRWRDSAMGQNPCHAAWVTQLLLLREKHEAGMCSSQVSQPEVSHGKDEEIKWKSPPTALFSSSLTSTQTETDMCFLPQHVKQRGESSRILIR